MNNIFLCCYVLFQCVKFWVYTYIRRTVFSWTSSRQNLYFLENEIIPQKLILDLLNFNHLGSNNKNEITPWKWLLPIQNFVEFFHFFFGSYSIGALFHKARKKRQLELNFLYKHWILWSGVKPTLKVPNSPYKICGIICLYIILF